jgi:hypothetical protein
MFFSCFFFLYQTHLGGGGGGLHGELGCRILIPPQDGFGSRRPRGGSFQYLCTGLNKLVTPRFTEYNWTVATFDTLSSEMYYLYLDRQHVSTLLGHHQVFIVNQLMFRYLRTLLGSQIMFTICKCKRFMSTNKIWKKKPFMLELVV